MPLAALAALAGCAEPVREPAPVRCGLEGEPLVIAHRGASGQRPEHTLEAYALAIDQGAHFIEPDLVITRDGVLIARHENELSATTDVAVKFPARRRAKRVDGRRVNGWFSEDFSAAEIEALRAAERWPFRDRSHDGRFAVPTFEQVLRLVSAKSEERERPVGVYPETKHPSHFAALGLALEEPLVAALRRHGLDRADAPVFIQSFEVGNLRKLNRMTDVPLVQLVGYGGHAPFDRSAAGLTYADMIAAAGLAEIASYADAIGAWKGLIAAPRALGGLSAPSDLIDRAHAAGLAVHAYTFRSEPRYLAARYAGDPAAEYRAFFALGVDGVFSDFPAAALEAARDFRAAGHCAPAP